MKGLDRLTLICSALAVSVILLGAYTRLVDAGLGCPDWPGCYHQLTAPTTPSEIIEAQARYPFNPVNTSKARTEMIHRYFAEALGAMIVLLALCTYWQRRSQPPMPLWLPAALVLLVVVQGMLGMWTVTLGLLPIIVVAHLLGGFATLALLYLFWLYRHTGSVPTSSNQHVSPWLCKLAMVVLGVLIIQILLGGWTSANYAALICPDFPTCRGQWWPPFSWRALNFLGAVGTDHPLGYMNSMDKTTIQMLHRLGASLTLLLVTTLICAMWQQAQLAAVAARHWLQRMSICIGFLLVLQICLGIANVLFYLPLPIALAHNGVAVILLLTLITLNFRLFGAQRKHHA